MEKLEIRKDGKLVETKWVYDEAADLGDYKEFDVTDQAIRKMFEPCVLAEDVTLKDIFLLLNTELEIFDAVIGNWCQEIVTEGLTKPGKPYDLSKYDPEQIEYLELSYTPEYSDNVYGTYLSGLLRPDLGGVGVELQNDGDMEHYKKGERIPWGVCMTPTNELINIPVKLSDKFDVHHDILNKEVKKSLPYPPAIASFKTPEYSLGNILYGIIWELSFHGGPDKRDEFSKDLKKMSDEIKQRSEDGTLDEITYTSEELKEKLSKKD